MGHDAERLRLNDVLTEAAQLTHDERRARILECVGAKGRHDPAALPICHDPLTDTVIRYCDRWPLTSPRPQRRRFLGVNEPRSRSRPLGTDGTA